GHAVPRLRRHVGADRRRGGAGHAAAGRVAPAHAALRRLRQARQDSRPHEDVIDVRIVLLGPPGVGKGTQGRRLAVDRGWPLISTGEVLRDAVARGTPLGVQAGKIMAAGQLVSDDIMIGLVRERTAAPDASSGLVLDGFPRTVPQAEALDAMLAERGKTVDVALALTAPEDELVRRLSARRECP